MNVVSKEKATVFFIHGSSSSSKVFSKVFKKNNFKYNFIAPDLPGHGNNTKRKYTENDYSIVAYKKFLLQEISNCKHDILLIGNSLGGHLAIEIANNIENLKGLVICGTPPVKKPINFEEAFISSSELNTFLTERPQKEEILRAAHKVVQNKNNTKQIIEDFEKSDPLIRKIILQDLSQNKLANEYELFINLNVPRYIIAGEDDPSVNFNYLKTVKNNCIGVCEILTIKNCGHYPSLDQPEEFSKCLDYITNKVF